MTDEKEERIRALNERIALWDAEHSHEIQQIRDANQGLKETLELSLRVAVYGSIPAMLMVVCWVADNSIDEPLFFQMLYSCEALVLFGAILVGAARAGGLLAHWWFWRSVVNQRMATIVIALTVDAVLFGWVMVFAGWWRILGLLLA